MRGTAKISPEQARALRAQMATPFGAEPPSSKPAAAPPSSTSKLSSHEARELRAQAATPFGGADNSPPAAKEPAPESAKMSGTVSLKGGDAAAIRAMAAMPFGKAPSTNTTAGQVAHVAHDATRRLKIAGQVPFAVGTFAAELVGGESRLVVVIKASAELRPEAAAHLAADSETLSGEVSWKPGGGVRFPSDWVALKDHADVVLIGHACAPSGRADAMQVRFAFGHSGNRFDKRLVVFGDRRWDKKLIGHAIGPPMPFDKLPLGYARAFGGAAHPSNLLGVGFAAGGKAAAALPNLEDPAALIAAPSHQPQPACFAPIPLPWLAPAAFDDSWEQSRAPLPPVVLTSQALQQAPPDQQLKPLRGNEPFCCEGMHAEQAAFSGQLPGVRPRAFLTRAAGSEPSFEELRLRLDTVCFDMDALQLRLLWRGNLVVADSAASDIESIQLMSETIDGPRMSLLEARHRLLS